ncbi:MAG: amino acid adenylation domain-containing protein [Drouetiella hepatica Uher 2000/2452]|jgi:amino acid adenylation domain-containing protein/thioester reductase-like protein|uniref:Amino acid adenylation domain-containing protein n=1 Tax=Drouetiella hepatica Uher 2000/2452 TaxID=904376 RepID=A0A951UPF4_9CYAN|nr:amino acid adenylation domain-containing protein [Drouetiella hepatica Uher 2000/2452]
MKSIETFLSNLYSLDVKLWLERVDGESDQMRLHCNAPEAVLTPDLGAEISARKAEIIAFLNQAHAASRASAAAIRPVVRSGNLPLSFAQQRLWFLDQMQPGSPLYHIPEATRLIGSLDAIALERSFNEIVRRHEALRTTFQTVEGQPVQVISPPAPLPLQRIDLQHLGQAEQEAEVLRLVNWEAQQPFNLTKDSLLRVTLVRLHDREHVALLTLHHIVSDAWSMAVLIRELMALYTAFSTGQPSPLPALPIQYADFAVWQRQWLQGEVLDPHLSYWRNQLSGDLPVLQLPSDRPRPRIQTFRGAIHAFELPAGLTESLKALSQQAGVTLFMTLLAAFKVLLYRYTAQEDILVGSPIANRNRTEVEGLIGFFVNTLVLRSNLSGNPTFRDLLSQVQQVSLAAYDHQDLPFEQLVEALQPDRDLSYSPLFQVKFALENLPQDELKLPNLTLKFLQSQNPTAKLDLSLDMAETTSGLKGQFEYNTDLFDPVTITRMTEHLCCLLAGIVEHPEQKISDLPLLTESEQHQQLVEWNDTQIDYPQNECWHQRFEAQVQKTPEAIALVFKNEQLTYDQLNRCANQVAHYLQKQGVKPETIVGLCLERSPSMIIGLLGILKAGGAYLPLDPTYPPDRLAFMMSDSQIPILLTTRTSAATLPDHAAQAICLDTDWNHIAQEREQNPESGVTVENLAYLIYTSGSTGIPKGVLVPHEGLINLTEDKIRTCRVQPDSRVLQFFSLSFDASIPEIVMSLGCGAALHLATSEDLLPGVGLLRLLREQAITHITLPPSALAALPAEALPALQMVLVGGEAPSPELIAQWSTGRRFINAYGPTETTVNASMVECASGAQPTIRPAANKQLYILDRHLQLVPIGVPGELYIGGVGLARGYHNHPAKTAEAFIPNPFSDQLGSRLYKTGDLACYRRDGHIKLLGRLDYQVKIRGFRIEPGEIEALLVQHPDVQDGVVIVREDRSREDQSGDKRLIAYVVPVANQTPTTSDLHRFIAEKLPKYMVPAAFVFLEALPLNPNGKVDRQALPAPDSVRPDLADAFIAPRTPTEAILAQVFAQVLEVKQVGIHDDFFELGGHSLLATRLIARLLRTFQIELSIVDLFEVPTVAGLAERIMGGSVRENTLAFLNAEAILDSTIHPRTKPIQTRVAPSRIFLTGATGFLGAFLLHELLQQTQAELYCLVRATSIESAQTKLQTCLESYRLWQERFKPRIIPVLGDLSQPLLGLSESQFQTLAEQVDVIYHSGAWVHHASPYSLLKATNVLGTQEVLRLACQHKVKPVHFMSATSVFSPTLSSSQAPEIQVIREADRIADRIPWGGYNQSKWVAERLVAMGSDRGIPISIYRLGRLSGHSQTGVFNQNDLLYRLIIGCVQLGSAPEDQTMLDMIPIDYASQAIVHLSRQSTSQGKAFHLVHPHPVDSAILLESLRSIGYAIHPLPYDQWRTKLLQIAETNPDHALYPLVSLFPARSETQPTEAVLTFDCQNTLDGLVGSAIACPPLDQSLLHKYFSHLIQTGFLATPPIRQEQ